MHTLFQFITRSRLTLVDDTTKWHSVKSLKHKLVCCTICCLKCAFHPFTPGKRMLDIQDVVAEDIRQAFYKFSWNRTNTCSKYLTALSVIRTSYHLPSASNTNCRSFENFLTSLLITSICSTVLATPSTYWVPHDTYATQNWKSYEISISADSSGRSVLHLSPNFTFPKSGQVGETRPTARTKHRIVNQISIELERCDVVLEQCVEVIRQIVMPGTVNGGQSELIEYDSYLFYNIFSFIFLSTALHLVVLLLTFRKCVNFACVF